MNWNPSEIAAAAPLVAAFERDSGPREAGVRNAVLTLCAAASPDFVPGRLKPHAEVIRRVYGLMGCADSRLLELRLEHKLVQALVLREYCGDAIPVTRGISAVLRSIDPGNARAHLDEAFPANDVLVKLALGYGSVERKTIDVRDACLAELAGSNGQQTAGGALHDERYVLQDRIAIAQEYRVHTFESRVIPDMTYRRHESGLTEGEGEPLDQFMQGVLDRLPNGLVRGLLGAWDVAATASGAFKIIEINLSGYHTVFDPGFHTSGHFMGRGAASITAKFLTFLERQYGVTFDIRPGREETELSAPLRRIERWLALHRIARAIDAVPEVRRCPEEPRPLGSDSGPTAEERAFTYLRAGLTHIVTNLRTLT